MARVICLLICSSFLFGGEEFIFWAKYSSSNNIIKSQNISISKAMVLTHRPIKNVCFINSPNKNFTTLDYLNMHKDELFECFLNEKILLNVVSKFIDNRVDLLTILTLAPVHFMVDFKPNGATISKFL